MGERVPRGDLHSRLTSLIEQGDVELLEDSDMSGSDDDARWEWSWGGKDNKVDSGMIWVTE